ncbi:amidohydrolase family protein [Actinomadura bangladeshensis]|uniref:6-methylsalicylate decarboxylase n=1 Tax=Actinomadura bangladeshensis TaxID=453573 RepID=A0A4V2XP21_9ACTN|nr:amidohydrolase family protein [Actinomadura bangladeshensis]TDC20425.1 amidohydrolase [Actinomadura bangladeshensis]
MSTQGLIDFHAHFTTAHYIEAAKAGGHVRPDGMPEDYWPQWTAEAHLALMDEAGIAKAMLSLSSPGTHFGDDAAARCLARAVNEFCAEEVRRHPDRFGQFATLPLPDVDGALAETAYCFDELGAEGVALLSNHAGIRLADERLTPVLAELDRRAAIVLLHPTTCPGHEELSSGRPQPMIEFLFETARTVIDFILSGAAAKFPRIRLIVPHLGGVLPLLTERVEAFRTISGEPADRATVGDILGRFYYDLAGMPSKQQIAALTGIAGPERLLYGSDYAWTQHDLALHLLTSLDAALADAHRDWRTLTTRNADLLLGQQPER